eukprot:2117028-Rhodomonas_salina.1
MASVVSFSSVVAHAGIGQGGVCCTENSPRSTNCAPSSRAPTQLRVPGGCGGLRGRTPILLQKDGVELHASARSVHDIPLVVQRRQHIQVVGNGVLVVGLVHVEVDHIANLQGTPQSASGTHHTTPCQRRKLAQERDSQAFRSDR